MPPTPRADAVRSRERILTAAAAVLAEDPTANMDAVVTRAGLARATVYRHFATRDDLVRVVSDRALALVGDLLAEARPADGDVLGAVERMTTAALAAGRSAVALVSLVAAGQVNGTSGGSAARVDSLLTEVVQRGQDEGTFRCDVPTVWLVDLWFAALQSPLVHSPPSGTDTVALVTSLVIAAASPPVTNIGVAESATIGKANGGSRTASWSADGANED